MKKSIFDISVCYTIGAFLLRYVGGITIDSGSFLILLITALISILLGQKRKWKIFTTILFPVVYLAFFLPAIPELVVFSLIWAYYFYMSITERIVINRGEFLDMLKRFLYLCLLLAFPMLTAFQKFSTAMQVTCPYLIAALVSAVFLLRHLRAVNQMKQMKQYKLQQFIELLAFLVICLMLTLARAPQYLMDGLKQMYLHLLVPILSFFASILGMLLYGIIYLVTSAVGFLTNNQELKEANIDFGNMTNHPIDITDAKAAEADWVVPILYSVGAIIVMVLLFVFFRWLMGEKFKQKMPSSILETREYLTDAQDGRAAFWKKRPEDSRALVRYYYGKCLLLLQHKRVQLKPQDTTEQINDKYYNSGQVNRLVGSSCLQTEDFEAKREALAQLKQIYRKARYQMTEQITKEEAEEAKQLYQTIKKKINK